MLVHLGEEEYRFPSQELAELADHTELYLRAEWGELRGELERRGYLRIRQLHDREQVLRARTAILEHVESSGDEKLDSSQPLEAGVLDSRCGRGCIPFMEGRNSISHHQDVLQVLEGPRPTLFFEKLLGGEVLTFDYKWLRGVHREAFTGAHVDNVYMSRGTSELYTMWTPLGDVTTDMGTLAVVESSNIDKNFKRFQETYGSCDIEKENILGSGWFTEDPREIEEKTLHMSTKNTSNKLRLSCDTRWQRRDQAVDGR